MRSERRLVLDRLHALVSELLDGELTAASDEDVRGEMCELERLANRLAAVRHTQVVEAERRGLPQSVSATSTEAYLRGLLRIDIGEARARVRAAHAAGPRWNLTGERLEPRFASVAAAQAAGDVSPAHASVVTRAIDLLPDAALDQAGDVERELVGYAQQFDARALDKIANRLRAYLDPDGVLADHDYRERHRSLELLVRADGSSRLIADLTAECTEWLRTVLDSLAAPRPAADDVPDPRTATQRRHDAVLDVLQLALRSQTLPSAGGVGVTVVLTATRGAWSAGTGTTRSGHGTTVPTALAKRWAGGDHRVMTVRTAVGAGDKTGDLARDARILGISSLQRCFTERQRLAMTARDRGCSFPGCDRPPAWCQTHHVIAWQDGGPTSTDNGTLLCGHHHRTFERAGWRCRMRDGAPEWLPPASIDPLQRPRTNPAHV